MKNILIVGGSGFLGTALIAHLMRDYEIVVASRNQKGIGVVTYSDAASLEAQLTGRKFYAIINCAVAYARSDTDSTDVNDTNVILPTLLAKYAINSNVNIFINCDSFYRRFTIGVDGNKYIESKKLAYKNLKRLASPGHTKVVNATIHHMYGKNDSLEKIITSVVHKIKNGEPTSLSACSQKRYFIDVEDVVKYFSQILKNYSKLRPFNEIDVAGNSYLSLRDFIERLAENVAISKITFDDNNVFDIDKNIVKKRSSPNWVTVNHTCINDSIENLL